MTPYKNLSGDSSVDAYEYTSNSITVRFNDGMHYLYSTRQNPMSEILQMQSYADAGSGLGTMLSTKPYHPHDSKW